LKVIHLVAGDLSGGAAQGAYMLHRALQEIGVDSQLLISGTSGIQDESVMALTNSSFTKKKNKLIHRLGNVAVIFYRKRIRSLFNTGFTGLDFTRSPIYQDADIVHLHWINGFVSLWALMRIKKPIVWTMRDMWPFTGGCHYAIGCENYKTGCGACPQLGSKRKYDLSRLVMAVKRWALPKKIELIGISSWLTSCAQASSVFNRYTITTISNGINIADYRPADSVAAKQTLGLPTTKKIILVGAQNLGDFYKGSDLINGVLEYVKHQNIHIVFFGKDAPQLLASVDLTATHLGFITDRHILRCAYSAADVFVSFSRMEAFGKTLAEAMSCGTPVVCFDTSGPKDIVEHSVSGYRAVPYDAEDMANGINWILSLSDEENQTLRRNAQAKVNKFFDSKKIALKYKTLYDNVLRKH
jgi:glycosyltransferase involved in cell wall biosynthesis